MADPNDHLFTDTMRRNILSKYLSIVPTNIHFEIGRYGKPRLAGGREYSSDLRFNVSHSADLCVVAVSRGREVGIDVERIRPFADCDEIANEFFATAEYEALGRHLEEPIRSEAFLQCWTRKESFLKAIGRGLSLPLNTFTAWSGSKQPTTIVEPESQHEWVVRNVDILPGYVGALASEGCDWSVQVQSVMSLP